MGKGYLLPDYRLYDHAGPFGNIVTQGNCKQEVKQIEIRFDGGTPDRV